MGHLPMPVEDRVKVVEDDSCGELSPRPKVLGWTGSRLNRMPKSALLLIVLSFLLFIRSVSAAEWSGRVVSVLDGDTIEVLHDRHAKRIQLYGIDCPRKSHTFEILVRVEYVRGNTVPHLI